jgi:dTMP kinase
MFYFRTPLDVALERILSGRPQLKYHEAGMDLGLSVDIVESFRMFQGLIFDQYEAMIDDYDFTVIDATLPAERQQELVRDCVTELIDIDAYKQRPRRL